MNKTKRNRNNKLKTKANFGETLETPLKKERKRIYCGCITTKWGKKENNTYI